MYLKYKNLFFRMICFALGALFLIESSAARIDFKAVDRQLEDAKKAKQQPPKNIQIPVVDNPSISLALSPKPPVGEKVTPVINQKKPLEEEQNPLFLERSKFLSFLDPKVYKNGLDTDNILKYVTTSDQSEMLRNFLFTQRLLIAQSPDLYSDAYKKSLDSALSQMPKNLLNEQAKPPLMSFAGMKFYLSKHKADVFFFVMPHLFAPLVKLIFGGEGKA